MMNGLRDQDLWRVFENNVLRIMFGAKPEEVTG
jgi:hypothetical protein